jgi:hypothetical protein
VESIRWAGGCGNSHRGVAENVLRVLREELSQRPARSKRGALNMPFMTTANGKRPGAVRTTARQAPRRSLALSARMAASASRSSAQSRNPRMREDLTEVVVSMALPFGKPAGWSPEAVETYVREKIAQCPTHFPDRSRVAQAQAKLRWVPAPSICWMPPTARWSPPSRSSWI